MTTPFEQQELEEENEEEKLYEAELASLMQTGQEGILSTNNSLENKFDELQLTLTNSVQSINEHLVASTRQSVAATELLTNALNRMIEQQSLEARTNQQSVRKIQSNIFQSTRTEVRQTHR